MLATIGCASRVRRQAAQLRYRAGSLRASKFDRYNGRTTVPLTHRSISQSTMAPTVAVLYQSLPPPVIRNVQKPAKPGGYRDFGADIAYGLQRSGVEVIQPAKHPDPASQNDWCYPDSESGILSAIDSGADVLWANTILFASHPLQTSSLIPKHSDKVGVIGQPPLLVESYDDKNWVSDMLRKAGGFDVPRSSVFYSATGPGLSALQYPVIAKPVRGRGSHGVKLCQNQDDLQSHLQMLMRESPVVIVEEYLSGQEGTVTVMPPSQARPEYWTLPFVIRFNHEQGIAPYSGVVAVTANSRAVPESEANSDPMIQEVRRQCARAAELLQVTAPVRIDVRKYSEGSKFALFDVNMKPNMTGPGRPGRENQASLTTLAAAEHGWNYPSLLKHILSTATPLGSLLNRSTDDSEHETRASVPRE